MTTTDLLVARSLPSLTGYTSVISNLGEVNNKGFELSLRSVNVNKERFSWNTSVNFSLNRNKIVHLYGDMESVLAENGNVIGQRELDDLTNEWFIGHDIDAIWQLKVLGVYQQDVMSTIRDYRRIRSIHTRCAFRKKREIRLFIWLKNLIFN